jgi:hypothetical protein
VNAAEGFQGTRPVLGLGHCSTASCRAVLGGVDSRCAHLRTRLRG